MQLTYYNNKSDKRYVNKTIEQISKEGHSNPVNIIILENASITNPVFKVKDHDIYMTANYCYIDDLRRYYFIDDIVLSNGYGYIHCTVDVLYTYREQLKKKACVIKRQEKKYNLYQVDDKVKLLSYDTLKLAEFPSGFDANKQEFLLCTIGNTND